MSLDTAEKQKLIETHQAHPTEFSGGSSCNASQKFQN